MDAEDNPELRAKLEELELELEVCLTRCSTQSTPQPRVTGRLIECGDVYNVSRPAFVHSNHWHITFDLVNANSYQ